MKRKNVTPMSHGRGEGGRGFHGKSCLIFASAIVTLALAACAQVERGDANQVYIDNDFALTDSQGIDQANKHCAQFGKIAIYRGQYSSSTAVFACVNAAP